MGIIHSFHDDHDGVKGLECKIEIMAEELLKVKNALSAKSGEVEGLTAELAKLKSKSQSDVVGVVEKGGYEYLVFSGGGTLESSAASSFIQSGIFPTQE